MSLRVRLPRELRDCESRTQHRSQRCRTHLARPTRLVVVQSWSQSSSGSPGVAARDDKCQRGTTLDYGIWRSQAAVSGDLMAR